MAIKAQLRIRTHDFGQDGIPIQVKGQTSSDVSTYRYRIVGRFGQPSSSLGY